MATVKEIWEAGRAALGLPPAASPDAAPPEAAPAPPRIIRFKDMPAAPADFDASAFGFENRVYRVRFKNGNSGEYEGSVLGAHFPFDAREIASVEAL